MLIKYVKNTSGSGANTMFSRNQFSLWNKTLPKIAVKSNPFVSPCKYKPHAPVETFPLRIPSYFISR